MLSRFFPYVLFQVEKAYVALNFLQPKLSAFLNFNQKTNFNQIRTDLGRGLETLKTADKPDPQLVTLDGEVEEHKESLIEHLLLQVCIKLTT